MPVFRFHRSELPAQPWKNGGGLTREIVCMPEGVGSAAFDWRVSIAHIASSGPFSEFAGVDRSITLLDGPGVHLRSPDGAIDHRLDQPYQPFSFAGEAPVQADLLGGDCHDFNVMTRRAVCSARVHVLRAAAALPECAQGVLLALRGSWRLQAGHPEHPEHPQTLGVDEGLWWHESTTTWRLTPGHGEAILLAVLIDVARP